MWRGVRVVYVSVCESVCMSGVCMCEWCVSVSVRICVCRLACLFAVHPALPLSPQSFQAGSLPAPGAHVFSARLEASQPQLPSHLHTHTCPKSGLQESVDNRLVTQVLVFAFQSKPSATEPSLPSRTNIFTFSFRMFLLSFQTE